MAAPTALRLLFPAMLLRAALRRRLDRQASVCSVASRACRRRWNRPWSTTSTPFPCRPEPIVPHVECVQDRITLGNHPRLSLALPASGRRNTGKRQVRVPARSRRSSHAALEAYRNTGYNEVLAARAFPRGDYPHIEELLRRLQERIPPPGREHLVAQPAGERATPFAGA